MANWTNTKRFREKGFCAGLRYHLNFSLKRKGLTSMCHCTGLTCNVSYMTATVFHGFHGVVSTSKQAPKLRHPIHVCLLGSTGTKPTHPALES